MSSNELSASARMNQYEAGKHTPDFLTPKRIAKELRVSTVYFYAEENILANLLKTYGKLSTAHQRLFGHSKIKVNSSFRALELF